MAESKPSVYCAIGAKPRKYTPEQLEAEIARPKKKGGRPKKYATEEERRAANAEYANRFYWRKKNAESFIVDDPTVALRKQMHTTDEERQESHRQQSLRYYYAHRDECTLRRAALRRNQV